MCPLRVGTHRWLLSRSFTSRGSSYYPDMHFMFMRILLPVSQDFLYLEKCLTDLQKSIKYNIFIQFHVGMSMKGDIGGHPGYHFLVLATFLLRQVSHWYGTHQVGQTVWSESTRVLSILPLQLCSYQYLPLCPEFSFCFVLFCLQVIGIEMRYSCLQGKCLLSELSSQPIRRNLKHWFPTYYMLLETCKPIQERITSILILLNQYIPISKQSAFHDAITMFQQAKKIELKI